MLSNIYLHEVLDTWFAGVVKPRLKEQAFMIRFADDGAPRAYMKIYMCGAAYEMRVGPSEPTCRSRLQTASSCAG